jgi:hypothetical protein
MRARIPGSLLIAALLACGLSEEERTARAADSIVALAAERGLVFRGVVSGQQVAIMIRDCKVYNLADKPRFDGVRPVLVRPDFYPWPTLCARESIEGDSAHVTVTIGRHGFGAGGCCSTGGTYRSRDGRVWERERPKGGWIRIDADTVRDTVHTP